MLSSWYVFHSDISFHSDIARDFFLLEEVNQKKFVLIGPHSSGGLYHGPLWTYLNYPAYLLGNGDPVIVGWYWIFLIICFLIANYFVAKNLFDKKTAYLFVLMTSVYMVFHAKGLFNPYGAMFLIPSFFLFFIKYIETLKVKYLIIHLIIASAILQFQIAIGIPFLILSFSYIAIKTIHSKKKKHLCAFFLLIILLGNFLIFNTRHDFILSKQLMKYLSTSGRSYTDYLPYINERIKLMFTGIEIVRVDYGYRNFVLFLIFLFFIFVQIKDKKNKTIYLSFLYFFVGFFILSLVNFGHLLYFYLFPIFPLVFLIFSSFITSRYRRIFGILFSIILILNLQTAISDTKYSEYIIGKDLYSWKFLYNLSSKVYQSPEKDFGYFVYSPDVLAYGEKYAMFYAQKVYKKNAYSFEKKPVTFLVIAPPPNPYWKGEWWTINQVKISNKPVSVIRFDNGYKIEKYKLSDEETKIQFDHSIDPGLNFR